MTHQDAVALLDGLAFTGAPETWADLGCGDGTFTRALASLLPAGSTIHALDRDKEAFAGWPAAPAGVRIVPHVGDFTAPAWPFGGVDGVLMANALHYVPDQAGFLRMCVQRIRPPRRVVLVEYDTDAANPWVPYPLSRRRLAGLFAGVGLAQVRDLGRRPSRYRRAELYAVAMSEAPGAEPGRDGAL